MVAGENVDALKEEAAPDVTPSQVAEPTEAASGGKPVSDPLKPLDQIFKKDRDFSGGATIEEHHKRLAAIFLHEGVPEEVRQIFETAKNISLYSHFAYRLHQPAELMGYAALEKAMRLRADTDAPDLMAKRRVDWWEIIARAAEDGWFRQEELSGPRAVAVHRARQRKFFDSLLEGDEAIKLPEPTEAEILTELKSMGGINGKLNAARELRNFLAHGSVGVSPSSVGTLALTAELINQLFPVP